ncbi:hypothetical protein PR202_gb02708 [Eleusine coracana subsp. coracana]|uniref:NAC domain-containing protein n=1 Tax=Eleusine coracana subsp. coracana TaxID=191504 RepID=A0AAV5E027_ELECO|nr:hypothetical protein QOZ80_8BG0665410 [Eleusine coracana subsp. coracana]GJN15769.1 hypothetical protein PR202_gb02708 [Eleusine coracana subsp. coracana]
MDHHQAMVGDALWDILGEEMAAAAAGEQGLPPGFRFHPTDEELVTFYLASKVFNGACCGVDIAEVDLNRCEPWDLPCAARMGDREWYFFSLRDRKYPTGLRTNRATGAGYWKATGKDREVLNAASGVLIGMKKTLVFYKGRAPRGEKTKWVLHEYRLDGDFAAARRSCKEEWVICRIFHKAVDQYSKMMMVKSPYGYHPMTMDPASSFCFQQELPDAALPLPNPSGCSTLAHALPFHHHHPAMENHHHLTKSNDNNGLPAACALEPNGSGGVASMPVLPFPSPFASFVAGGKAAPPPHHGVNAGPPEPTPPTWMDGYLQHSGFLYEMGPPAAPRGA